MTITLTTFIPGTKAKADEVNANFSSLKDAVNSKASMNGDETNIFNVADATAEKHAVNKGQIDILSDNLKAEINKFGTKFCVKSGNTTNGNGDLFSYDVYELTAKIGGTYKNLIIMDYKGVQTTISSTPAKINLTGNANGEYNIFITPGGELYILNNTIYRQAKRPTMVVNDIWLDISSEPFNCIKYSGTSDVIFLDVPLGKVKFEDGAITSLQTFPFNQNGCNITSQSILKAGTNLTSSAINLAMPDYSKGITVSSGYVATCDGWLNMMGTQSAGNKPYYYIDGALVWMLGMDTGASEFSGMVPMPKGSTMTKTGWSTTIFYPSKGEC